MSSSPPDRSVSRIRFLQVAPLAAVFLLFFLVPLLLTVVVSFWDYGEYEIIRTFTLQNYRDIFSGCLEKLPDLCVTLRVYWSTFRICAGAWMGTFLLGFTVAYFLRFHVRTPYVQAVLFLVCTIPFWTSNVIRTIALIPLLGRNGIVNGGLMQLGLIQHPKDWLLFSEFSIVVSFVYLYTLFMMVPIYNSMRRIDPSLLAASRDAGADEWDTLLHLILPLCKPGIAIGSIFVVTLVMGDFVTIGVMGGQQIASIGKVIDVEMSYVHFPAAAANSVILLCFVFLLVGGLSRSIDIRKELR
jgi:putative spermidine/putrescine transport system permease protein